jgi:hypothetical protein
LPFSFSISWLLNFFCILVWALQFCLDRHLRSDK